MTHTPEQTKKDGSLYVEFDKKGNLKEFHTTRDIETPKGVNIHGASYLRNSDGSFYFTREYPREGVEVMHKNKSPGYEADYSLYVFDIAPKHPKMMDRNVSEATAIERLQDASNDNLKTISVKAYGENGKPYTVTGKDAQKLIENLTSKEAKKSASVNFERVMEGYNSTQAETLGAVGNLEALAQKSAEKDTSKTIG